MKIQAATRLRAANDLSEVIQDLKGFDGKHLGHALMHLNMLHGVVSLSYSIAFRRTTPLQAWKEYQASVIQANGLLETLAAKYKDQFKVKLKLALKPSVDDDEYSTSESSFDGVVSFRA